ncbi:tonB-system energizer ExbB [Acetobacter lambici]|uniref:Biopolymer transport protein ExbB n=1 Tax=Acetobacter lambici TaxID=1332824 RepID=A0ABT1F3R6_9PROT|nr:tonB-system energizer ExbB [Acetobacter lambici]MCP1243754.1 tonB-system energizer ExbB [Acetobacter lambici]MCP1259847.1 tonB-system energizer ExbB [Acetobacter lambici]NHO57987.1 tonB-system energizer ExbB [Acetobacter lambici]
MPSATQLSQNFSPWDMFLGAGAIVQSVMIILALASLLSWTVLIAKSVEFIRTKKGLTKAESILEEADTLDGGEAHTRCCRIAHTLVMAAETERVRSQDIPDDTDGLKERIVLHLERLEAAESRRLVRGTGLLATIGATSPFVGLFGTVWGIMTSFTGIAASKATSLAVVAPGIAEALLATALGLVAAIPAVVIYNHLARQSAACRAQVADIASLIMRLVSRDLGRMQSLLDGGRVVRFGSRATGAE